MHSILFLSPRQCWPAQSGAKLREYHFAKALGQRFEIDYAHFTDVGSDPLTAKDLTFCRRVIAVPKPPSYGPWQMLQGVAGHWPLPVLNYSSREMAAVTTRLLAASKYDLVHLDSIHMIRYAPRSGANIVYNWHNVESEAMLRYAATVASLAKRLYSRQTARKLASLEREILGAAFGHIVCSDRERADLLRLVPDARIAVIENGVDCAAYSGGSGMGKQILFVGSMNYYPNIEAAVSFARNIWPKISERLPGTGLVIAGANPAPEVLALRKLPGVTVTGAVPDLKPYYRDALAAVAPLRTGGGTRLKILEAMAAQVPVVSTPLGAEGLAVVPGENILLAGVEDANAWTAHLCGLAQSPEKRARLAAAGLALARSRYDWEIVGAKLCDTYKRWLAGGSS